MRLNFHKIEIHNFMSFADEVFDFDQYDGMSLVTGKNFDIPSSKNGSGKSTCFQALLFGLYGQLSNKIKAEHVANRFLDDKEVRVVVYLDVDNESYIAVTGLNKRAAGYFVLKHKAANGEYEDLTKSSIAETREFFENEILRCDISLFLRTILLTSEQNYNFFNLKKQDKKDFIEKLFDIGVFGDMFDKIHRDVLALDKKIVSVQNQLIVLNRNDDDYKSRIQQFDDQKSAKAEQLKTQIATAESALDAMTKNAVEKNTQLIEKYEDAIRKLTDAKQKADSQLSESRVTAQRISSDVQHQTRIANDKKHALEQHKNLLSQLCDDCKDVFLKYHNLTTYKDEIAASVKVIQEKTQLLEAERSKCKDIEAKTSQINERISTAQQKISELSYAFDKAKKDQANLQRQLDQLKFSLTEVSNKVNPYIALRDDTEEMIKKETQNLEQIEAEYKYLKKSEEIVSQESLKKFIIKDLIGLINSRIKQYLMRMGAKYTCVFDENLDFEFMTDSGSCELQNFSCGEKKRLEIATCLSFRDFIAQRSNLSSNILIIDEYIDSGIDTLAVDNILMMLREFTFLNHQSVFVISHRSEVNNESFRRILEVQKRNGISSVKCLEQQ